MNVNIITEKNNTIAYDYLIDNFAGGDICCKSKSSKLFHRLSCEFEQDLYANFLKVVAKAIVISRKYPVIIGAFKDVALNYANIACLSALLYFDINSEVEQVIQIIKNQPNISVEGTFDFKLSSLLDEWEELKSIGAVLCYGESEDDIYNVTTFMMSNRTNGKSLFLAQYPDILLANVTDGLMVEQIKLYDNPDFNLINTIIAECPAELIIEQSQIKQSLLDSLAKLVTIKTL